MSRWFIRFQPLGGTSQRYLDKHTGRTLSRRHFLRYQGICPEMRAAQRKAAGPTQPRKVRCDKGQPRFSQGGVPFVTSQGTVLLRTMPDRPNAFAVVQHAVQVAVVQRLSHGRWERWQCATCALTLRSQRAIVDHALAIHTAAACQTLGLVAATVTPIRFVAAREHRARMPWRVQSADPRYQ